MDIATVIESASAVFRCCISSPSPAIPPAAVAMVLMDAAENLARRWEPRNLALRLAVRSLRPGPAIGCARRLPSGRPRRLSRSIAAEPGTPVTVDDDLILWLTKDLRSQRCSS